MDKKTTGLIAYGLMSIVYSQFLTNFCPSFVFCTVQPCAANGR
jgi:hypothetical protein